MGDYILLQRILANHTIQEMTAKYVNLSTTNIKTLLTIAVVIVGCGSGLTGPNGQVLLFRRIWMTMGI